MQLSQKMLTSQLLHRPSRQFSSVFFFTVNKQITFDHVQTHHCFQNQTREDKFNYFAKGGGAVDYYQLILSKASKQFLIDLHSH